MLAGDDRHLQDDLGSCHVEQGHRSEAAPQTSQERWPLRSEQFSRRALSEASALGLASALHPEARPWVLHAAHSAMVAVATNPSLD